MQMDRTGNTVCWADGMAHGEHMRRGAMKLLHVTIVEWLLDNNNPLSRGVQYFAYGAIEAGRHGLCQWKHQALFAPHRIRLPVQTIRTSRSGVSQCTFERMERTRLAPQAEARISTVPNAWGRGFMRYTPSGCSERAAVAMTIPDLRSAVPEHAADSLEFRIGASTRT
jgi:hypothetical protein